MRTRIWVLVWALCLGMASEGWGATFGKTTVGATLGNESHIQCAKFTSPAGSGTITKMSVYTSDQSAGSHTFGAAIYSDNAGDVNALLATDSGNTTVTGATEAWYDINISYAFSASTVYWLCYWPDSGNSTYRYDTGATNQFAFAFSGTFETWPNPGNEGGFVAREPSIYATYTPAGGSANAAMRRRVQ